MGLHGIAIKFGLIMMLPKNGAVVTSNGSLTGTAAGTIWDFNNGAQGWTFSSATYVGHYNITCLWV